MRWGRPVWPPGPVRRISTRSAAEVMGPGETPTWPTSRRGSQCRANTARAPSTTPGLGQGPGPGGDGLLGRLEARPGPAPRRGRRTSARARAAPTAAAAWRSWPQAWHTPGDRGAVGHVLDVVEAQGVDVGPQGHQRAARCRRRRSARCAVGSADDGQAGGVQVGPGRRSVVRSSSHDGSGWACRSRRSAIRSASTAATASADRARPEPPAGPVALRSSRHGSRRSRATGRAAGPAVARC